MIKIAVPVRGNKIDDHFGHCEYYAVYTVNNSDQVAKVEKIDSAGDCGCKTDVAETLFARDVTVLLAGNIGDGEREKFEARHIRVLRGNSGDPDRAVQRYLASDMNENGNYC